MKLGVHSVLSADLVFQIPVTGIFVEFNIQHPGAADADKMWMREDCGVKPLLPVYNADTFYQPLFLKPGDVPVNCA